ncbi:hypothetical protein MalM25_37220 [Planctomycetes bacterium MalM25]|nr:hypothetical protein MalM25_37220 [Planctomycetes bacterium MalM25]
MKKLIALCIVTTVVTSVTGCGCCRRMRDFICRGSRCRQAAVVAPAPICAPVVPVAPMAAAPMCDPGCGYAGFDPGCGYSGPATYGYGGGYGGMPMDTGWMPGPGCNSCSGGYTMPSYDGGYSVQPGVPSSTVDPGPAAVQ